MYWIGIPTSPTHLSHSCSPPLFSSPSPHLSFPLFSPLFISCLSSSPSPPSSTGPAPFTHASSHLFSSLLISPLTLSSPPPPAEIIMHEGVTAVYKSNVDLFFYILGAQNENEVCTITWTLSMCSTLAISGSSARPERLCYIGPPGLVYSISQGSCKRKVWAWALISPGNVTEF